MASSTIPEDIANVKTACDRLKYNSDFLQRIRSALRRQRVSKGFRVTDIASGDDCINTGERAKAHVMKSEDGQAEAKKLPGHILREHKTLHTHSITRRKNDATPQKALRSVPTPVTPKETGLTFVSDHERSEVLRMREQVRLSMGSSSMEVPSKEPVKNNEISSAIAREPRRQTRVEVTKNSSTSPDFLSVYDKCTLGGKKKHALAAFNLLENRFGADWLQLFHFEPYYYPIVVPIPFLEEKKNRGVEKEKAHEDRWSFGRTVGNSPDNRNMLSSTPVDSDIEKLNKVIERLSIPIHIGSPLPARGDTSKTETTPFTKERESVEDTEIPIVSCFQVRCEEESRSLRPDPRMIPYKKKKSKPKQSEPNRKDNESSAIKIMIMENTEASVKKPRKRRSAKKKSSASEGECVAKAAHVPSEKEIIPDCESVRDDTQAVKKSASPKPFSARKRLIMPIMQSKKFVLWLHITNHPEPPYKHSYLREITESEGTQLRRIVESIPNRPDPIDPSVTDEEYFEKVAEWTNMLDSVIHFVAPKPTIVDPPNKIETLTTEDAVCVA